MNINTLALESMRLEGQRFKLYGKLSRCENVVDSLPIRKELKEIDIKITQYNLAIDAMRTVKRKMNR